MPSIGIIVNPYSKKNKRKPQFADNLLNLIDHNDEIVKTKSLEELDDALIRFKEKNYSVIGIVGGDGTINLTLDKLLKLYDKKRRTTLILPMKGGTINVLATHLNIPYTPYATLKKVKSGNYKTTYLNTLSCNGRVGFIYADGAINNFLEEFYKISRAI